uniref:Sprouty protein n=1 Tax=Onchocerca volvulus TaxID=6282 RepID=A0A8R1TWT0_ONCVO
MYRSQLLSNENASNSASISITTIPKKGYQKKQVVLVPKNKLQTKKRTFIYHRYISHTSGDPTIPLVINHRISHPIDAVERDSFLKEMNNLSVYENNDRIVLPKRKEGSKPRLQCFYCGEWFANDENTSGSCKEAPDPVESTIRFLTCYSIAEGAVYHCCRNDDDMPANISHFGQGYNVFSFGPCHISPMKRVKRWLFLALMSLVVPCLCCYFPARMINKCFGGGRRGRHQSYHSRATFED